VRVSPEHGPRLRVLIVKLSSLGDVVHAMPVVHDIQVAFPGAQVDWVVEPGFAPLVRRVAGIGEVIECALRRWSRGWWRQGVRAEWRAFRARLQAQRYDAVLDLQGLTKSVLIARLAHGTTYGLANRTDGASFEAPARWLVDHPVRIEPRTHALDRSRLLAARALGYGVRGAPNFGLRAAPAGTSAELGAPTLVFVHGTSRDDKLWPEANWIELGRRTLADGWRVALPHAGDIELERARRLAEAIGATREAGRSGERIDGDDLERAVAGVQVWPAMALDALVDRLGAAQGVIGVDSGLSHIAVALGLPHVQLYNWPTAWRTGPQREHGHRHQVSIGPVPGAPGGLRAAPSIDAVWAAWSQALSTRGGATP
jgi:heptosyltransferase I